MKNRKKIVLLLIVVGCFLSCSDYNKVLKGDNYERKFQLAEELYTQKEYGKAIPIYEQIYQRMPKTGEGELSYFRIGKSYFEIGDFDMAGYYLGAFSQRYPFSPKAQEALFLSAMCSVQNSPEYSLDQNDTEMAINNLQQFVDTYPESILVDSCNHIMDRLRVKIERKEYDAVKLYAKTENYRAAVTSSVTFLEDYPKSSYREEVFFILINNSFLLAVNSVENKKCDRIEEAIERYRNFEAEFPNSTYKSQALGINDKMQRDFEINCNKN